MLALNERSNIRFKTTTPKGPDPNSSEFHALFVQSVKCFQLDSNQQGLISSTCYAQLLRVQILKA